MVNIKILQYGFPYYHYLPKIDFIIILPIFLSMPALDIGIPVFFEICCLAWVIPSARFHEKVNPGIFIML